MSDVRQPSQFRFLIDIADGNDFKHVTTSHVEVAADSETEGKLIAQQMAMTPQPGKPAHMQITRTRRTRS